MGIVGTILYYCFVSKDNTIAYKAPGKHYRDGLTTRQFFAIFPHDKAAESWFIQQRWPEEVCCPSCGVTNVQTGCKHKTMPFRCREKECGKHFSVKTGTFMQSSKIGYQSWLYAFYLFSTNLKGVSSMKLHRELGITQKSAWHLAHRIRHAWNLNPEERFKGPVEADETYLGGKRRNMPKTKRAQMQGRGSVGKTAVVGVKDRATKEVRAQVVEDTKGETLRGFVLDNTEPGAKIYTDEALFYKALPNQEAVRHASMEYVRGECHTNGVESFWSLFKRAYMGTFHQLSERHLHRYVGEFAGRHNMRELGTLAQMALVVDRAIGRRLRYKDLVG